MALKVLLHRCPLEAPVTGQMLLLAMSGILAECLGRVFGAARPSGTSQIRAAARNL